MAQLYTTHCRKCNQIPQRHLFWYDSNRSTLQYLRRSLRPCVSRRSRAKWTALLYEFGSNDFRPLNKMSDSIQTATFGGGCFWCTEAVFEEVKGVQKVVSGYSGGNVPGRPTYREVCSGLNRCCRSHSGHFRRSDQSLLKIFWSFL